MNLLVTLLFSMLPPQVCGEEHILGLAYVEDTDSCADGFEHVCDVGEWPPGWEVAVCCSQDTYEVCTYAPGGVCLYPDKPVCGFIPQPEPEPWVCSSLGTLDAYVNVESECSVGELHVCTHGETPPDPLALVCCTDNSNCRLEPGDGACGFGEWLACSHDG